MDLTILKGKIVIFPYGSKFKGYRVDNETPKKFEFDTYRNYPNLEYKPKPDMIMKNSIIHVTEDREEAIKILQELNSKAEMINKLSLELTAMKRDLKDKLDGDLDVE